MIADVIIFPSIDTISAMIGNTSPKMSKIGSSATARTSTIATTAGSTDIPISTNGGRIFSNSTSAMRMIGCINSVNIGPSCPNTSVISGVSDSVSPEIIGSNAPIASVTAGISPLIASSNVDPSGRNATSTCRPIFSICDCRSPYCISLICSIASTLSNVALPMLARISKTFSPRSSYCVPNKLTAAVFFASGSSKLFSASSTSKNASFAVSPPAAKRANISSAFRPSSAYASALVVDRSLLRMLNSLTASPTLSIENTPSSPAVIRPCTN